MKTILLPAAVLTVALSTGCATLEQQSSSIRRQELEIQGLRGDVMKLRERVNAFEDARDAIFAEVEMLSNDLRRDNQAIKNDLRQLQTDLENNAAADTQAKKELVETLSKQIASIIKQHSRANTSSTGRSTVGREHVVQSGETLSAIAKAYGTTVEAIMRANKISNANLVRAKQTLFIPE